MRVLVVWGSKMGGTAGLADMVARSLDARGHDVAVEPATGLPDLAQFDAVVVGGALYSSHWHRDARRFVRRHTEELKARPVWLFSSGPLDASAAEGEIPPVPQVRKLMDRVGARGHVTFGGRMPADAKGFPASAMARNNPGDWRDPDHVDRWVAAVLEDLEAYHSMV